MAIPITDLRSKTVEAVHYYHLTGGIHGFQLPDGDYAIGPTTDRQAVAFDKSSEGGRFGQALKRNGLEFFGHEEIILDGNLEQSVWYLRERRRANFAADHAWGGIAYNAHTAGDEGVAETARHIAFALEASSLRLRDISRQYRFQNLYAVRTSIKPNRQFDNLQSFDLQMNLHSVLVEMCTARDYLARFASEEVFGGLGVAQMGKLFKKLKAAPIAHPLADGILLICDEKNDEGWMARLGQFRDIIIHEAPIVSTATSRYLIARELSCGGKTLYRIEFNLPRDPRKPTESPAVDALSHFWTLVAMLRDFANFAATFAKYPRNPPTLRTGPVRPEAAAVDE